MTNFFQRHKRFLLNLAKSIFIGHIVIIAIVSLFVLRCASDLKCLLSTTQSFPVGGAAPSTSFDKLELLNHELGLTDNVIGCDLLYVPAMIVVVAALNADNLWLARRAAFAVFLVTLLAILLCIIVCWRLQAVIDSASVSFVAQNAVPLLLVNLASLLVLVLIVKRPSSSSSALPSQRQQQLDSDETQISMQVRIAFTCARVVLIIVALLETIFALLVVVSPQSLSASAAFDSDLIALATALNIGKPTYSASIVGGIVALHLMAAVASLQRCDDSRWLLLPSVLCHCGWLVAWTLLVASAERHHSTRISASALAVGDELIYFGLCIALVVLLPFVVYVLIARHVRSLRRHLQQQSEHESDVPLDVMISAVEENNSNNNNNHDFASIFRADDDNNDNHNHNNDNNDNNDDEDEDIDEAEREQAILNDIIMGAAEVADDENSQPTSPLISRQNTSTSSVVGRNKSSSSFTRNNTSTSSVVGRNKSSGSMTPNNNNSLSSSSIIVRKKSSSSSATTITSTASTSSFAAVPSRKHMLDDKLPYERQSLEDFKIDDNTDAAIPAPARIRRLKSSFHL